MTEKLILSDVDGVLLSWEDQFHAWMQARGQQRLHSMSYMLHEHYDGMTMDESERVVREFNGSGWMLGLPAFRDARVGVARLVDAGYRFHAITAMGECPYVKELRRINLDRVFGHGVFVEVTATALDGSKQPVLEQYRDSGLPWIEDKPENAELGHKMGLSTFLVDHLYNQVDVDGCMRVSCWSDICDSILGSGKF